VRKVYTNLHPALQFGLAGSGVAATAFLIKMINTGIVPVAANTTP